MYEALRDALRGAAVPPARAVLLTASGPLFTSGNDMGNFAGASLPPGGIKEAAEQARVLLESFVGAFLDCPVPVVAAVNGPAVGIGVTLLPLCDIVYASHKATFHTPFAALGLAPEACSSVTFPRLMGPGRATEALLLGRKLTALEAEERGLVASVVEDALLASTARRAAEALAALPPTSVRASKRLIREGGWNADELRAANTRECSVLAERWASEEAAEAIVKFLSKGK
jgi:peroxisomal 3,2-trans-enoyl-CoA isomerase